MLAGLEGATDPMLRGQIAIETALLESYSGQHQLANRMLAEIEPTIAAVDDPSLQIALLDARGYVALALNDVARTQPPQWRRTGTSTTKDSACPAAAVFAPGWPGSADRSCDQSVSALRRNGDGAAWKKAI
jgi:hypothetical protein